MLKWEDYIAAARELSPSGLNLYMYLAKNQDNYELWFSSKDYCKTFNVVDKTFRNARNELIQKGYLKFGENNHVYFDSRGAYKETKEGLQKRLKEISCQLKVEDSESYEKLVEETMKANIKGIEDENVYKIQIKKLISLGEDLLKDLSATQMDNLL